MDAASRAKAEKIRIALEKMKEASVKKLFIKAFSADGSTKSLLVDEKMTCAYVTRLLADKNHVHMDPKWGIVEHLPDLYMGKSRMLMYIVFWLCYSCGSRSIWDLWQTSGTGRDPPLSILAFPCQIIATSFITCQYMQRYKRSYTSIPSWFSA
jgi:hypothetical protein